MTGRKYAMKTTTRLAMFRWGLLSLIALGLASCAEPPQAAIESATSALEEARTANGNGYAPEAFKKAEEVYASAMAEVESQGDRSFFMRSYRKANELLTQATEASNQAKKDAEARRQEMQAEADVLIKDVQKRFESAEVVTEESRRPGIKETLEKAGAALFEADKAFKAGDFLGAYGRAQDAQALIEEVMTDTASVHRRGET
jgi:hypothetical protein